MTTPRLLAAALILAASTAVSAPAFAADGIDATFFEQKGRIEQGIRSGALTEREAVMLRSEQSRIANMIARARIHGNGRIYATERSQIERAQAAASRHIYAEKHDRKVRPSRRPGFIDDSVMRRDRAR